MVFGCHILSEGMLVCKIFSVSIDTYINIYHYIYISSHIYIYIYLQYVFAVFQSYLVCPYVFFR